MGAKVTAWIDIGTPDFRDPLDSNAWAHRALVTSMHEVVGELAELQIKLDDCKCAPFGSEDDAHEIEATRLERRAELREIAASMRGLMPQARLRAAEDVVRGASKDMDRTVAGPVISAIHLAGSDSRPKAKRGRPRKRSLL